MQSSTLVDQVIYIRYSSLFQEKKKYAKLYGKDTFFVKGTVKRVDEKNQKVFVYLPSLLHTEKLPVSVLKPSKNSKKKLNANDKEMTSKLFLEKEPLQALKFSTSTSDVAASYQSAPVKFQLSFGLYNSSPAMLYCGPQVNVLVVGVPEFTK